MSNRKGERVIQKQLPVTTRCLAIVLTAKEIAPAEVTGNDTVNGKEILDEFKLRNKACFWNPALLESIDKLEYLGFVSPCTLLVGGSDLHLENLRTAWGRRVLKEPTNFTIQRVGDVHGIEMDVIPQTQFVPLPEILCWVIMDLNNRQIIATLDMVQDRLRQCYKGMALPSTQLIYDTLGSLIRERKVFHNGSGYFVVTPDTYRLPDDPMRTVPLPWLHYNPMYIPVLNQGQGLMRSISCQVTLVDEPRKQDKIVGEPVTTQQQEKQTVVPDNMTVVKPNFTRSLSARRPKEKNSSKEEKKELKRSLSLRARTEKEKPAPAADINLAKSNVNKVKDKGSKKSLISKIFGRKKKRPPAAVPEPVKEVEYATFSAQFPPPEWLWYKEQVDKQQRIQKWVQQVPQQRDPKFVKHPNDVNVGHFANQQNGIHQLPRSQTWHHQKAGDYEEIDDVDIYGQAKVTLPPNCHQHNQYIQRRMSDSRHLSRKHEKRAHRHSLDRKTEQIYQNVPIATEHMPRDPTISMPYHSHSNETKCPTTSHPLYSSTPRGHGILIDGNLQNVEGHRGKKIDENSMKRNQSSHLKGAKSKRKSHQSNLRHHENDISFEYHGRLPQKNSSFAVSCDSGVNCVGLSERNKQLSNHRNVDVPNSGKTKESVKQNNLKPCPNGNNPEKQSDQKNQIICEAEINKCVKKAENEYVTMTTSDQTNKMIGCVHMDTLIESSEQSYETVIKTNTNSQKQIEEMTADTKCLDLGDSGFSSPRNLEDVSPSGGDKHIQSKVEEIKKASTSDLCVKNMYQHSDEGSHCSDRQGKSYNNRENKLKVLNNLRHVNPELNINKVQMLPQYYTHQLNCDPHLMHQIPLKINFDDDFEVVGVV